MINEFVPGDRVQVSEGFPGTVTANPVTADTEHYFVVLDDGVGEGWWGENELIPLVPQNRTASSSEATVEPHAAAVDYPELGDILTERPDYDLVIPADEYLTRRMQGKVASLTEAIYLPLDLNAKRGSDAYKIGYSDGKAGSAQGERGEMAYTSDYLLGWSDGLMDTYAPDTLLQTQDLQASDVNLLSMDFDPVLATRKEALVKDIIDFVKGSPEPTDYWAGPGRNWSYDWCRFRRDSHCWLPKELNRSASDLAGYAVWVPEDRGYCKRQTWEEQQACPVPSQPGPNVPGGFTDATVPWDEGGQRGGIPTQRIAATTEDPDGWAFHYTAAWVDVRDKAVRIRKDGKVRVVAVNNGPDGIPETVYGQVEGDNKVYDTGLTITPGGRSIAAWECTCAWAQYAWGRTRQWVKFEGRMCSHALALVYEMQSRDLSGLLVWEDPETPEWVPKTSGRAKADEWPLVHALLRTGASVAKVQAIVAEHGAGPRQREAARGIIRGQVNGQVVDLEFNEGKVFLGGTEFTGTILYPDYHPTRGLTASKGAIVTGPTDEWLFTGPGATTSELKDEPEPAIPFTTAEDDEPEVSLLTDSLSEPAQPVLPKTAGAWWGEHYEDDTDEVQHGVKCKTCEWCGGHNPEYVSECEHCDRCTFCGEVQPTGATPRETYELREPHRMTHLYQAKQSSTTKTSSTQDWVVGDNAVINGEMWEVTGVGDDYLTIAPLEFFPDRKRKVVKPAPGQPLTLTEYSPRKQSSTTKTASAFSRLEEDSILNEGEGTQARNLASLDLTGTHYQALEPLLHEPGITDDTISW